MHKPFFYISPDNFNKDGSIYLSEQDTHQVLKVWRKSKGEVIYGKTYDRRELELEIIKTEVNKLELKIIKESKLTTNKSETIYCFLAIPKLSTLASVLPKLSELDVDRVIPLLTERSFLKKAKHWNRDRFERIVRESFKQCGRQRLLKLCPPVPLTNTLEISKWISGMDLFVPWEMETTCHILDVGPVSDKIGFLIGPEGGLTQAEIAIIKNLGFKTVSLGDTVLKVENAVISTLIYLKSLRRFYAKKS